MTSKVLYTLVKSRLRQTTLTPNPVNVGKQITSEFELSMFQYVLSLCQVQCLHHLLCVSDDNKAFIAGNVIYSPEGTTSWTVE